MAYLRLQLGAPYRGKAVFLRIDVAGALGCLTQPFRQCAMRLVTIVVASLCLADCAGIVAAEATKKEKAEVEGCHKEAKTHRTGS